MKPQIRLVRDPHLQRDLSVLALNASSPGALGEIEGFFQRGGNVLHVHEEGGGKQLRAELGGWLHAHGHTDRIVLGCLIGHDAKDGTGRKDPASLEEDINANLALLRARLLDLVYLDPPAAESAIWPILQTLAAQIRRGKIRAYGLRNWTAGQIRAVMEYARKEKLSSPAVLVTTELSSAIPNLPLWEGYIPFDAALRDAARAFDLTVWAWLTDINQALFVPPNERAPFLSAERMNRWSSKENEQVLSELSQASKQTGLTLRQVNAAALLSQPFRTVGIISRDDANLAALDEFYAIAN